MTSLRKSVLNASVFAHRSHVNDDEAERNERRSRSVLDESSTPIDENEMLKTCLKDYQEQKLNKENAWSVPLIDTLSTLMQKHNKLVKNFQVVGSSLEASSKIYGLRVDSVHMDVMRMSSGLTKQKFVDLEGQEGETEQPNNNDPPEEIEANKPQKKKKKQVCTIVKNKGFLNANLETIPFIDSFFSKLNTVENISGPNRALLNMLPSTDSELKIKSKNEFWDSKDKEEMIFLDEYPIVDVKYSFEINQELKIEHLIRPKNSGYMITDTPDDEDEDDFNNDDNANHFDDEPQNQSVAFDINAEIDNEPENNFIMDVEMDDFDCLTAEDQRAIAACKGLRREPVTLEDMRPIDSTDVLEYSYRPTDIIDKFWAGPSHWKFKRTRNTLTQTDSDVKVKRKKKKFEPITIDVFNVKLNDDFYNAAKKRQAKSMRTNWDYKKNLLPTNLLLDENKFSKYHFAPGLGNNVIQCGTPDIIHSNNNTIDDNVGNDSNDDFNNDCDMGNEIFDKTMQNSSISFNFIGAPDMIEKLQFKTIARAKVIDMKLLKSVSWRILNLKSDKLPAKELTESDEKNIKRATGKLNVKETYTGSLVSYTELCKDVYSNVNKTQADNMSRAVAFYTILHLANEHNLRLIQADNLEDFKIYKIAF